VKAGDMVDLHGSVAPMYLMGYFHGGPVYRTTITNATGIDIFLTSIFSNQVENLSDREGHTPGSFQLHWSPLFPEVFVTACGLMQIDVTIRTDVSSLI
jgi:hypothetical protein